MSINTVATLTIFHNGKLNHFMLEKYGNISTLYARPVVDEFPEAEYPNIVIGMTDEDKRCQLLSCATNEDKNTALCSFLDLLLDSADWESNLKLVSTCMLACVLDNRSEGSTPVVELHTERDLVPFYDILDAINSKSYLIEDRDNYLYQSNIWNCAANEDFSIIKYCAGHANIPGYGNTHFYLPLFSRAYVVNSPTYSSGYLSACNASTKAVPILLNADYQGDRQIIHIYDAGFSEADNENHDAFCCYKDTFSAMWKECLLGFNDNAFLDQYFNIPSNEMNVTQLLDVGSRIFMYFLSLYIMQSWLASSTVLKCAEAIQRCAKMRAMMEI